MPLFPGVVPVTRHKEIIIVLLVVNALLTVVLLVAAGKSQPAGAGQEPQEKLTDASNDLLLSMLYPYIETAVNGHYKEMNGYGVQIPPQSMEVLALKRLNKTNSFSFAVTVRVTPYTAGYRKIGEDVLAFEINHGIVRMTSFKHLQDFPHP